MRTHPSWEKGQSCPQGPLCPTVTLSQGLWGLNQGLELHLPGSLGVAILPAPGGVPWSYMG